MRVTYIGPFDAVEVIDPATGEIHEAVRGAAVDLADELALRLLDQAEIWRREKAPPRERAKTESTEEQP